MYIHRYFNTHTSTQTYICTQAYSRRGREPLVCRKKVQKAKLTEVFATNPFYAYFATRTTTTTKVKAKGRKIKTKKILNSATNIYTHTHTHTRALCGVILTWLNAHLKLKQSALYFHLLTRIHAYIYTLVHTFDWLRAVGCVVCRLRH